MPNEETPDFRNAVKALETVIADACLAKGEAGNLRAVLSHAVVEIALRQEGLAPGHVGRAARRAELWKLSAAGLLTLSVGRDGAEVEIRTA